MPLHEQKHNEALAVVQQHPHIRASCGCPRPTFFGNKPLSDCQAMNAAKSFTSWGRPNSPREKIRVPVADGCYVLAGWMPDISSHKVKVIGWFHKVHAVVLVRINNSFVCSVVATTYGLRMSAR